jgi:hypothetical protein
MHPNHGKGGRTIKLRELIEELQKFDPEANVVAVWELTENIPDIYVAKCGTVILDVEGDPNYKEQYIDGTRKIKSYKGGRK